ncbi:MAG: Zn-ribbon containing protein [archaeon]
MPHQCVRCGLMYGDGSKEILSGCTCGARLFFYIRKEKLEQAEQVQKKLTKKDKDQIESDVLEIVGLDKKPDEPIVLDLESIRIAAPGKYEIDLVSLFKKKPLIYKLEEGKYMIDLPESFREHTA